jgi:deazaflavin-dependent oxidoreductase (nitroreductase family)
MTPTPTPATRPTRTTRPTSPTRTTRVPAIVRLSNPITRRLLRIGLPMGPNVLLTVRGRTSGEPRTAPVAIAEIDGRRWVIGAYGEVHWVRNLRAAGEALITTREGTEHVRAVALDQAAATAFFGETLPGYFARLPWFGREFVRILFGLIAPDLLRDPERAAATRPVFELRPATA